jgi:stage II sporulation protein D
MCSMLRAQMRSTRGVESSSGMRVSINNPLAGTALLAAALVSLSLATTASTAGAASSWVVKGAGWGHGVGMSAYGAYGYGKNGAGYRQILDHYFRHLKITKLDREPSVRVLLETTAGDVAFTRATSACGEELKAGRTYLAQPNESGMRLTTGSGRTLARCGKSLRARGRGQVEVKDLGTYRGVLVVLPSGASANVINDVPVNDYVRGSVPAEVPASWPRETLEAMAVASRSIALSTDVGGDGYQLYPDTRTQLYNGISAESPRSDRAVKRTFNEVATYHGDIVQTTYFSSSGGITESHFLGGPAAPYLESVEDPYDTLSPLHRWTMRFSQSEMDTSLGSYVEGNLRKVRPKRSSESPRIDSAKLVGSEGTTTIRGDTLAAALGLYSRWAFFKRARTKMPQPGGSAVSLAPGPLATLPLFAADPPSG